MPISVKLSAEEWREIINFVAGDLANMDEQCPVRQQMDSLMVSINEQVNDEEFRRYREEHE